jgi:pimeloyl-ACP methyl ester carboxylesterase
VTTVAFEPPDATRAFSEVRHAKLPSGLSLAYQTMGEGEPLLLVMGLGAQMLMWPDTFCAMLAERGFRVIRFDNRDVGLSTRFHEHGAVPLPKLLAALAGRGRARAPYRLHDMADDAAQLLDALGIDAAHVVGASLGGMVAQQLAIQAPGRVRSLTSIMSTTGSRRVGLPSPRALSALLKPAPTDEESQVRRFVWFFSEVGSPAYPADPADLERIARASFARGLAGDGFSRQLMAVLASGNRTAGLQQLDLPALVIHGDADPLVTLSGGEATARAIPGATWMRVAGMGHDLPQPVWPRFVDGIQAAAGRA